MKNIPKNLIRSPRPTTLPTVDQLHTVQTAITALNTALEPLLQPLTEGELRDLLKVGIGNEAFTRDYVSLVVAHPDLLPSYLRSAETHATWQAREAFAACAQAIAQIGLKVTDTVKAFQSDCYAAALSGYRILVKGGVPAAFEGEVAPLREHMAQRQARRAATRAANLALKAAQQQNPPATGGGTTTGGATSNSSTVIPMSPAGSGPTALAA